MDAWAKSWLARPGKRAATVARDTQGIGVFLPSLGDLSLATVTPRDVQEAVDERSRHAKPATVRVTSPLCGPCSTLLSTPT